MNASLSLRTNEVNSTQMTDSHPAVDTEIVRLPDFLLMPLVEAAFAVIKKNEESDLPTSLRRISHFDSKALNHATARTQIIQSLHANIDFCALVEEEFFQRVEVSIAYQEWSSARAADIVAEAATRNDLPLLASMLWLKKPSQYLFALGLIVGYSSLAVVENEQRDSQRAEETRLKHLQTSYEREKSRADLLHADVERLEGEMREERKSRRVREQRQEAQMTALQKQVDSHDEVVGRMKDAKDRQQQRVEREASRAHELEARLRVAHEDARVKSEKITQLQEQLASALSSDMELTYEDLQNLILAQQGAENISHTILKIMNKTRSIVSDNSSAGNVTQSSADLNTALSQTPAKSDVKKTDTNDQRKRTAIIVPPGLALESDAALRIVFAQPDLVVLIDGYNVSLNSFGELSLELQRDRIVACATNIETRYHPSCVVVFDGQSSSTRGRIQSKIHVVFSPAGISADDVIIERIRVTPIDCPILVVTSDRNLSARARGLGCQTISSNAFVSVAK